MKFLQNLFLLFPISLTITSLMSKNENDFLKDIAGRTYADNSLIVTFKEKDSFNYKSVLEKNAYLFDKGYKIKELNHYYEGFMEKSVYKQIVELNFNDYGKDRLVNLGEKLFKSSIFDLVTLNYEYSIDGNKSNPQTDDLWGYEEVGSNLCNNFFEGTRKVKVGIIDSGIAYHNDLNANLISGYDYINNNEIVYGTDYIDGDGHGTHVAGIVGALNNNVGNTGVCPKISLVPLRVINSYGQVYYSELHSALSYAIASYNTNNPISVVNFSIGSSAPMESLKILISQYPGLFVCSTGNERANVDIIYHYPAFYGSSLCDSPLDNIISVGRIDQYDNSPDTVVIDGITHTGGNYGNSIFIYSPGQKIYSTYLSNTHEYMYGSSMSTPFVTGTIALLKSINPNYTNTQIKNILINSADTINMGITGVNVNSYQVKKLNTFEAMRLAIEDIVQTETPDFQLSGGVLAHDSDDYLSCKNKIYKISNTSYNCYNISLSSSSYYNIYLYDDDFNMINSFANISSLSTSITVDSYFYVRIEAINTSTSNYYLDVSWQHIHNFSYTYYNYNYHRLECSCGATSGLNQKHVISLLDYLSGNRFPTCLDCGSTIDMNISSPLIR